MRPRRCRKLPDEPLADRVARLERVLGRLLIFLAAAEIIGEEDVAAIEKDLHRKAILTVRKELGNVHDRAGAGPGGLAS